LAVAPAKGWAMFVGVGVGVIGIGDGVGGCIFEDTNDSNLFKNINF
jgi:hypothetical protein